MSKHIEKGTQLAVPTVLTANTRLARELVYDYDRRQLQAGSQAWAAGDILPFGSWLERCWKRWLYSGAGDEPARLLRASQEQTIWEQIVRSSGNDLLGVASTAEVARDAWNLLWSWNVPLEASEWSETEDSEVFRGWAGEFRARCADRNWLSRALLPHFIMSRLEDGSLPIPSHVVLVGFNEPSPVERRLQEVLVKRGCQVEEKKVPVVAGCAHAARFSALDRAGEIRAAAEWARRSLEETLKDRTDLADDPIGVVVPDLASYRGEVERVFAEVLHANAWLDPSGNGHPAFNISLAPPLGDYPLVQTALLILRLNPHFMSLEDAGKLLRSPFTGGAVAEHSWRALLDREVRRFGEPEVSAEMILERVPYAGKHRLVFGKFLDRWRRRWVELPPEQSPSRWAASFSGLLDAIGWPGDRVLDTTEFQTVRAWSGILSELASIDTVARGLDLQGALDALGRLARTRLFQPESERSPIQVLGLLEATGLRFRQTWIMGMHDGAWPRPASPNPFLPSQLQRRMNLPRSSPERELEFAELLTSELLASAPSVVVSFPGREGDCVLRASPLVTRLREIDREDLGLSPTLGVLKQLQDSGRLETVEDHRAPSWNGVLARGGTAVFEHQAACPFRSFAIVRLGAERLENAVRGLGPIERGILVHDALQRIWSRLESHQRLHSMTTGQLETLISETVEEAIEAMSTSKRVLREPRFRAIEQARLERLLVGWLEIERGRRPFRVVEQEAAREVRVAGLDLSLRVDRVDRLDDGTFLVVDYKTGEHGPAEWASSRPEQPQLPLYAATSRAALSGVFFGILKTGKTGFSGLATSENIVPGVRPDLADSSLEGVIDNWTSVFEQIGRDFREGDATVDPKDPRKTCRYCHLTALCRIAERVHKYEPMEAAHA